MSAAVLDACVLVPARVRDVGQATHVVTNNLRDFPASRLPKSITACDVDEFLCTLLEREPEKVREALSELCARSGRKGPRIEVDNLVDRLASVNGARKFAQRFREAVAS